MLWQRHLGLAVVLAAHGTAFSATATTTRIDFEGLTPLVGDLRADVSVNDFYNGGRSTFKSNNAVAAQGPVPGPGVTFSPDTWVTETAAGGNGGSSSVFGLTRNLLLENGTRVNGSNALGEGIAISDANVVTVSFAAGFNNALSFFFNSSSDLTVSVLRNDGSALAADDFSFSGTVLCADKQTRCEWSAASLAFVGTAYVVKFAGVAGDFALDNLTFGSLDPFSPLPVDGGTGGGGGGTGGGGSGGGSSGGGTGGGGTVSPIPEPSTYALMGLGLVLVGAMARRRQAALSASV